MAREYLKKAPKTSKTEAADVSATVRKILDDIEIRITQMPFADLRRMIAVLLHILRQCQQFRFN